MRIAIIGGGAAGLMAAASAVETNPLAEIFLVERNKGLGKKVIISGGGRCNVTTGLTNVRDVLTRYPRGAKFLTSAMHQFPPQAVYDWFEAHGVPLKVEEDLRVFPVSDNGHDIVRAFEAIFRETNGHVQILLNHSVVEIQKITKKFHLVFKDGEFLDVDKLILTTGGQAYRETGSTGDGYAFAESLGHTITPLAPSLSSFFTLETWPHDVSGLSFERATVSVAPNPLLAPPSKGGDHDRAWTGPFLFTHKGISGPAVFALSGLVAFDVWDKDHPLKISLDLFPAEKLDAFTKRLSDMFKAQGKKDARNVLGEFVPKSMADVACQQTGVAAHTNAGDLTKVEIQTLATWLKAIPLNVIGRGAGDEFVTAGGVSLSEVNPSTMESKIQPGLFFAGELLDVDGFTGGFNLQASWATGKMAGESAAQEK